jgi:hypothetical protein
VTTTGADNRCRARRLGNDGGSGKSPGRSAISHQPYQSVEVPRIIDVANLEATRSFLDLTVSNYTFNFEKLVF